MHHLTMGARESLSQSGNRVIIQIHAGITMETSVHRSSEGYTVTMHISFFRESASKNASGI